MISSTESKFIFACCSKNDEATFSSCDSNAFPTDIGRKVWAFCANWLSTHGRLPSVDRVQTECKVALVPTKDHANECLTDLKSNAQFVSGTTLYKEMSALIKECAEKGLSEVESGRLIQDMIAKAQARLAQAFTSNREVLLGTDKFKEHYQGIIEARKARGGMSPIQYPWPTANEATLGIDGGQLIAIVGRPGDGKTTLLIYMLTHFYRSVDRQIMVVSNEINSVSMTDRILSTQLKIAYSDMKAGNVSMEDISLALDSYSENPILITDAEGLGAGTIEAVRAKAKNNSVGLLIVDGAYLMKATGRDMYANAASVCSELKAMASSLGIPVIITWQLNRSAGDGSKAATETIAYSDKLSTDADVIIAIVATNDMVENGQRVVRSVKVRDGKPFEFPINCNYDLMDFSEIIVEKPVFVDDDFAGDLL